MCFSATASFVASGAITGIGLVTKPQVKEQRDFPIAVIPFIFALQQGIEGAVWLSLSSSSLSCLTYSFVFFSHLFWPTFVPLAFYLHERESSSRKIMRYLIPVGFLTTLYLSYFLYRNGLNFIVNDNQLSYYYTVYGDWWVMFIYFAATVAPAMLSSSKILRIFGWALTLSYFVSVVFYIKALYSVWCFFAALLSIIIFWHFHLLKKNPLPNT